MFEIGSITKVFTASVLASMVARGEVRLDDPVARYLPPSVKAPTRGGKEITLAHLATHTSGLPRLPPDLQPSDPANPYADCTVDQMYQFLSAYALPRDIGAQYEYSNLGMGLLGPALARRAGKSYEELVIERVLAPLAMSDTRITPTPGMGARFDSYVGVYELAPGFCIAVTRAGDALFGQATGQPRFRLYAESETEFFLKEVDAQITFARDSGGKATELVLHQEGRDMPGRRIAK